MAEGFAAAGATVGICARRADRLDEVLDRCREHSPHSQAWTVDLGDIDRLDGFAADVVEELGGLDVLVNNAGMPKRRWAWEHRPDEIASVLRLNVESPLRLTLALLDALAQAPNGGHVVFIGSVAARLNPPSEAVYAASKAAITNFAECLLVDLRIAGRPVDVHVVQPGVLDTELFGLPDNDPSISDIEPLAPAEIVAPVISSITEGGIERFVPEWFADVLPVKHADPEGFLEGSVEYTKQRLADLGREVPA
jgi:short-subunit dehydrogenase